MIREIFFPDKKIVMNKIIVWLVFATTATFSIESCKVKPGASVTVSSDNGRWSAERAQSWARETGWLVGCNFGPSNAINQLEMWQESTFDTATINRELGWAASLGFNSIRVFLHNLLWDQDSAGFLKRMDQFLAIADRHKIGTMFVLFDGVWDPFPRAGQQRDPKPHVHNSGWVQSPGVEILKDTSKHDGLRNYVQGVVSRFKNDKRVHMWDVFNEPDNINRPAYVEHEPQNKAALSLILLKKSFAWIREVNPSQPVTSAPWKDDWSDTSKLSEVDKFMFNNSDVISFHCYDDRQGMINRINQVKVFQRPAVCTEYMARAQKSTFQEILPVLKENNVGGYNWGFVAGKTQTIYPWDSWTKQYTAEPELWFHDIFRSNGEPYRQDEVDFIRSTTSVKRN